MDQTLRLLPARVLDLSLPENLPAAVLARPAKNGNCIRVCAVGDVVLSDGVKRAGDATGYEALFSELAPFLRSSVACFANLECALTSAAGSSGLLVGSPEAATGLRAAGITVLNLANNHVYDTGAAGLACTLRAARDAGLVALGAGADLEAARALIVTEGQGLRIGWLGCGRTLQRQIENGARFWEYDRAELTAAISTARRWVDILFVSIHIGYEYIEVPSPEHRNLAHACVGAGANVVLMHHPHVLQGIERIGQRGVICYSLGNFLMDPASGHVQINTMLEQRRTGAVFVFDIEPTGACQVAALPIYTDERFCLHWAVDERGRNILRRLISMNEFLRRDESLATEFERQRAERNLGTAFSVLWQHALRGNWRILLAIIAGIRPHHLGSLLSMLRVRLFCRKDSFAAS